ncbi:hypothetical protein PGB90_004042 [Kerria lacca]
MVQSKPMIRGMITYSITWPIGNLIQQTFEVEKYNLAQTLKFGLYGSLYVAPTIHKWMQFSCYLWPKNTIEHTILKAYTEQLIYSPFAICSFFFIITLMEGGSIEDGMKELNKKLIPTWKISAIIWPVIQSINYTIIPEKNRVPFVGLCSLAWTAFLTFIKYQDNRFELRRNNDRN